MKPIGEIGLAASELNALSSSLGVSSQTVVSDFLAEGSKNSSLNLTEQFLKNQFERR